MHKAKTSQGLQPGSEHLRGNCGRPMVCSASGTLKDKTLMGALTKHCPKELSPLSS